jgi:hypothetical protein
LIHRVPVRVLQPTEIANLAAKSKDTPEHSVTAFLDELERKHAAIYRVIYGEPSDAIAAINEDMANLYLELAVEVVWIFAEAFGKLPEMADGDAWVFGRLAMIDAELKSIAPETQMDAKFRTTLQDRFANSAVKSGIQMALLAHLRDEIERYASFNRRRGSAIHLTNNMLFVLVRLLGDMYCAGVTDSE